jgi:hypothetical protein
MLIKADKFENAILAILHRYPDGKGAGSLTDWRNSIEKKLRERPNEAETVAALKRVRDSGLVRLINYSRAPWWEFVKGETIDERAFFYTGSFSVIITDAGRGHRDMRIDAIGFRRSA